jgi:hypothetical protein
VDFSLQGVDEGEEVGRVKQELPQVEVELPDHPSREVGFNRGDRLR